MNDTTNYIFRRLRVDECAIRRIKRTLSAQNSINNAVCGFAIVATIGIISNMKDIKNLKREIAELKHSEGEQK